MIMLHLFTHNTLILTMYFAWNIIKLMGKKYRDIE